MKSHTFSIGENANNFWLAIDDSRYYFSTPEERKVALERCNEHATELQRTIESKLGRKLTQLECLKGVAHSDDRSNMQKVDQRRRWEAVFAAPPAETESNPFKRQLAQHFDEQEKAKDPKAYALRKLAEKWDAEQAAKAAKEGLPADPRRQKIVGHAKATLTALKFDPRAPAAEIEEAEWRVRLAKEGDLTLYEKEANVFITRYTEHLKELARPTQEKAALSQAEIQQMSQLFTLQE